MTYYHQKNKKKAVKILEERWPKLFNFDSPKPLMIGVSADIFAITDEKEHVQIKKSIQAYAGRLKYVRCLAKGGARYNLEGKISGEVSKEAQLVASHDLRKNAEKVKTKAKNRALEKKNQEVSALRKITEEDSLSSSKNIDIKIKKEKKPSEDKVLDKPLSLKVKSSKTAVPKIIVKKKRTVFIPQ